MDNIEPPINIEEIKKAHASKQFVAKKDKYKPCRWCGWGQHMAIHHGEPGVWIYHDYEPE